MLQRTAIADQRRGLGHRRAIDCKSGKPVFTLKAQSARTSCRCNVLTRIDLRGHPSEHANPCVADCLTGGGGGVECAVALDGSSQASCNVSKRCARICRCITKTCSAYYHRVNGGVTHFQAGDVKRPAFKAGIGQGHTAGTGNYRITAKDNAVSAGSGR